MKVKRGIKAIIKKRAEKLSRKLIAKAENYASEIEGYYIGKEEKRQTLNKNKLASIERMLAKAKLDCQELTEETNRKCDAKYERAKNLLLHAIKTSNSIQDDRRMIDTATEAFQNLRKTTVDHSDRAEHKGHIASQILRQINYERDRLV